MAAVAAAITTTTTSKRKRSVVSYVIDDYYDKLELEHAPVEDESYKSDDDGNFGSRRTKHPAKKAKIAPKFKKLKEEKPFRFLDLPAELRDEIYEFALFEPNGLTLVPRTKACRRIVNRGCVMTPETAYDRGEQRPFGRYAYWRTPPFDSQTNTIEQNKARSLVPNLLAVNKQIRQEASAMLYHQEIILEDTSTLLRFVAQIGPHNRQLLTSVTIQKWGQGRGVNKAHNFASLSILATCTNLKTLFLDCSVCGYNNPIRLARQVYRDGHYFLEAMGAAKGRYDAALEVLQFSDRNFNKHRNGYYRQSDKVEFDPEKREKFDEELRTLLSHR